MSSSSVRSKKSMFIKRQLEKNFNKSTIAISKKQKILTDICNDSPDNVILLDQLPDTNEEDNCDYFQGDNHDFNLSGWSSDDDSDNNECQNVTSLLKYQAITKIDSLRGDLKQWALTHKINHKQLSSLLVILKKSHPELPLDSRTLLETKINNNINVECSDVDNSLFTYIGLQVNLESHFKFNDLEELLIKNRSNSIDLIFNIDGIPISQSSSTQFWPILGMIYLSNAKLHPFVVALFCGSSKPNDVHEYLYQFVEELNNFIRNGFTFNNITYQISIKAIICDAPARSFIKCTKSHTGFYGCERCTLKGISINHKLVYPNDGIRVNRTNRTFLNKCQPEHHTGTSPLIQISNFGLISGIPLDYMHMLCLGVARKLIGFWIKSSSCFRVTPHFRKIMSERSLSLANTVPSEFSRKPRSMFEVDHWKATELRFFLMYSGPIILRDCISNAYYQHFMLLHVAMRLLGEGNYEGNRGTIAKNLIHKFVQRFEHLYGTAEMVYNVHSCQHLVDDCVAENLKLDDISCFPFENALGHLKKLIRTSYKPLQQVVRRLREKEYLLFGKDVPKQSQKNLSIKKNDCYALLTNQRIGKIIDVSENMFKTHLFGNVQPYFQYPINSTLISVFKVSDLGQYVYTVPFDHLVKKCWLSPSENEGYIAAGLLHMSVCISANYIK